MSELVKRLKMKKAVQIFAYLDLLVISMILGFLGKPTEMGLAIAAGVSALAFSDLERFKRFKGAGFEAEMWEQVEAVLEKQIEPDSGPYQVAEVSPSESLDASKKAVLRALNRPEYTWRYLGGVVKDTKKSAKQVHLVLNWLVEQGYARRSIGTSGPIWGLTEKGRITDILEDFEVLPT